MKKVFHLKTCSTCIRIIKEVNWPADIIFQNIKEENLSSGELDMIADKVGSYEALFSRRAMKYKSMGLSKKELTESDIKQLILDEYTFLKRPVVVYEDQVFIGNSKKVVAQLQSFFTKG